MSPEGPERKARQEAYTSPPKKTASSGGTAAWLAAGVVAIGVIFAGLRHAPEPVVTPEAPVEVAQSPQPPTPAPVTDSTNFLVPGEGTPAAAPDDEPRPVAPIPPRQQPPAMAQQAPPAAHPVQTRVDLHWTHDNSTEYLLHGGVKVVVDGVDWGVQKLEARETDHLSRMRLHQDDDVPDEIVHQAGSDAKLTAQGQRPPDYVDTGDPRSRSPECIANDRARDSNGTDGYVSVSATTCPAWDRSYNIATRVRLILPVLGDGVPHTVTIKKLAMVDGPETSANYLVTTETFRREAGAQSAWRLADTKSTMLYAKKIYIKRVDGVTLERFAAPTDQVEGFDPAPKGRWRAGRL